MTVHVLMVNNRPQFYIEGVNDPIPVGTFEISDEDHEKFLSDQGKYRFVNQTLTEVPVREAPPVSVVSSVQALIQLSRMPHDGSVVPGTNNLLDATEALVEASGDRELKTWFNRSQTWQIANPNVQKIGSAFKLTASDIQAAFEAAAKIEG